MKRLFVRTKIHRATVTDANLDYEGSISLCPELMRMAGLMPFEFVHVNNVANGVHWETYVIPGEPGQVVLNGPPAHHFKAGNKVVIFALAEVEQHSIPAFEHTVVYVNDDNSVKYSHTKSMLNETGNVLNKHSVDLYRI